MLDVDWRHTVGGGADPWGQDAAGTDVGLGFRGELVVDGLVWLRARAYDPATRAFLSPDPLEAVLGTAFAANPYHYAGNDPVNQVDPLGLRPVTDAELAGEHDSGGGLFSKIGHGVLDVAGLVPGVGEVADLANAAWYTAEGDYTMAALSAAAAIPFAGWAATGAKAAIKGTAAAEKGASRPPNGRRGRPSALRQPGADRARSRAADRWRWQPDGMLVPQLGADTEGASTFPSMRGVPRRALPHIRRRRMWMPARDDHGAGRHGGRPGQAHRRRRAVYPPNPDARYVRRRCLGLPWEYGAQVIGNRGRTWPRPSSPTMTGAFSCPPPGS